MTPPLLASFVVQVKVYSPGIGWTAQMASSNAIWAILCHVIAIRQSSAQLSIINNCNEKRLRLSKSAITYVALVKNKLGSHV